MAVLPLIFIICVAFTESVSKIMITPSSTDLVEFNSSVTLSCSASGSPTSFLWLNGSSGVTASDRVQLTDGGSNLTIINVTRSDRGPFRCRVSNPVSTGTSDPVTLNMYYGPENIQLKVNPSQEYYAVGSDILFRCSADSRPSARFHWLINGVLVFTNTPSIGLINALTSQSGNYSCQAFNSRTLRYQTSQPLAITIVESSGCGASCTDEIVIGCGVLVAGVAVVGVGYYIYKKRKHLNQSTHRHTSTTTGGEGRANPASSNQELNFADVRFFPNRNGGSVQMGLHNNSSYYASSPPSYEDVMQQENRFGRTGGQKQ